MQIIDRFNSKIRLFRVISRKEHQYYDPINYKVMY